MATVNRLAGYRHSRLPFTFIGLREINKVGLPHYVTRSQAQCYLPGYRYKQNEPEVSHTNYHLILHK